MKKIVFIFSLISTFSFAQVAIGTTTPSSAAVLHLSAQNFTTTNRGGFLMPVVTEVQQALIPVVASDDGLMVFVSDTGTGKWCWDIYDGQDGMWRSINCKPITIPAVCDTQIYLEDFAGYSLNTGRDRRTDSGGYPVADWVIDDSAADTLGQDNDYAYTNAGEEFELNNTDGPVTLTTRTIDISTYATVCFSVDIRGTGGLEYDHNDHANDDSNNKNDYINIEYSIDGGAWVMIIDFGGNGTVNHTLVAPLVADGTFPDGTVSESGLSGSTIRVRITSNTWASSEKFFYDNIIIEGGN